LPSIKAMSAVVAECASDQTARPVESTDMASMVQKTMAPNLRRPVKGPTMKTMLTGIRQIARVCRKLDSGVGFSSGTALLGPYQPPPLLPSCLIATIGATGPSGIFCALNSALASTGTATGPPASVAGTPCQVSSAERIRHNGSTKRSVARTTSAQ